jgi:hypothetical protein
MRHQQPLALDPNSHNPEVVGSNPTPATNLLDPRRLLGFSREAFLSFGRLKAEKVGPLARKLD